jgi:hypothetical protein
MTKLAASFRRQAEGLLRHPESRKASRTAAHIMDPVRANLITFQVIRCQRDDDTVIELRDTYKDDISLF